MGDEKCAAVSELIKASQNALTLINELLIDNAIDESAFEISDNLYNAIKAVQKT